MNLNRNRHPTGLTPVLDAKQSKLLLAVAVICHVAAPAGLANGEDTELRIRQVPKEKQLQEDARDEGLAGDSVPDRCSDPDVAAKDPACARGNNGSPDLDATLPVVEDTADDGIDLLPGVTINQSPSGGR
jgi:hypothetical protein